eukprot:scaffold3.g6738.t1
MSTSDAPSQSQQQERSQQQTSQQRRRGSSGGRRSKKRGRAVAAAPAEEEEMVLLTERVAPDSERLRPSKRPVRLCSEDKASAVKLDERQLSASSRKGYRMVRATHGAHEGTWYFEVSIDSLGPTGAARLGWATRKGELLAPVGADEHSYAYRSTEGSKVHRGLRESYGEEYGEGDVVGCILHLPPGGRPIEKGPADVVKYKSSLFYLPDGPAQRDPRPLEGSFVAFTRNGRPQGRAYEVGTWARGAEAPAPRQRRAPSSPLGGQRRTPSSPPGWRCAAPRRKLRAIVAVRALRLALRPATCSSH